MHVLFYYFEIKLLTVNPWALLWRLKLVYHKQLIFVIIFLKHKTRKESNKNTHLFSFAPRFSVVVFCDSCSQNRLQNSSAWVYTWVPLKGRFGLHSHDACGSQTKTEAYTHFSIIKGNMSLWTSQRQSLTAPFLLQFALFLAKSPSTKKRKQDTFWIGMNKKHVSKFMQVPRRYRDDSFIEWIVLKC